MKSKHPNSGLICTTNSGKAEGNPELVPQETGRANSFHLMSLLITWKCTLEAKVDTPLIKFNVESFRQDELSVQKRQKWNSHIFNRERT